MKLYNNKPEIIENIQPGSGKYTVWSCYYYNGPGYWIVDSSSSKEL